MSGEARAPLADLMPSEARWQQDADGVLTWVCPVLANWLGEPQAALAGRRLIDGLGEVGAQLTDLAAPDGRARLRVSQLGQVKGRWVELNLVLWQDEHGQPMGGCGLARDVGATVALEDRLQRAERRLLSLAETASEGIAVVQDQVFRFVNRHLQDFLGLSAEQLLGRPFMDVIHPDDRPMLIENHHRRLAGLPVPSRYEFRLQTHGQGVRWLEMSGSVVEWEGRPATLTHIADISARKALDEQVRQLAFQDTLTGLANRRLLEERLHSALTEARQGPHHGALLYLDLNAFKPLNDTHGHAAGDQVLVGVAQRLRQAVRATDLVARLGGDEFVVLLSPLAAEPGQAQVDADRVAGKVRHTLAQPHQVLPPGAAVAIEALCTASVGVALFGPDDEDAQAVLERADQAMYRVKADEKRAAGPGGQATR